MSLTVLVSSLCLAGTAAQAGSLLEEYFPLQTGDQKTLVATVDGNAESEVQTLTNVTFDGNDVFAATAIDTYYGGPDGVTAYFNYSGDQVLWYGASRIASGNLEGGTLTFDPPVVFLDEQSLSKGGTHKFTTTATAMSNGSSFTAPVSYSYSVTSAGTLTVPAGTFSNCVELTVKATLNTKNGTRLITVTDAVLAPNVGIIQEPIGKPTEAAVGLYQLSSWSITLPFTYSTNNSAIAITGYDCSDADATVPSLIGTLPVTSIGPDAFYDCTNLTSVTIPASIIEIGSNAFYDCTNLKDVYFEGNAPTLDSTSVFATTNGYDPAIAYYLAGATGFGTNFGGLTTAVFSPSSCTKTVSPTTVKLAAKGGTKSVSVKVKGANCSWTAVSNDPFITITSGTNATGNGKVIFTVPGNTNTTALSGTMTIAGQTVTVTQAIGGCTFKLSPKAGKLKAAGGTATVKVKPNLSDCVWTAASTTNSFITLISGTNATGPGVVTYSVPANTNATPLTGSITIAGQTFTVTQAGVK